MKIVFTFLFVLFFGTFCNNFLFAQDFNFSFRARVPYPRTASVWGYVDSLENEYALVGVIDHTSIVDVTNPDSPIVKFRVDGPSSNWREIKTNGKYAYVTNEGGGGVTIIDLRHLPDTVYYKSYTGDGAILNQIDDIHALHIDNNKLYLYGSVLFQGKAYVLSIEDPWNPVFLAPLSSHYTHDGFVKNDTLYACNIFEGFVEIIDARNPSSPVIINNQITPFQHSHNSWLSKNGKVMFTTDEVDGSFIASYDISDLSNIKELDRFQRNNTMSIPHNVNVLNDSVITNSNRDYLFTAYYTDGVTITDASKPDNLVEIAHFDTSPQFSGGGTDGAWGVYPYLPSGNILVSDIQKGLYILSPEYKKPCYLEIEIIDSIGNLPIPSAFVKIIENSNLNGSANLSGKYKTGTINPGQYTLLVSKDGYKTISREIVLKNDSVSQIQIVMNKKNLFDIQISVQDSNSISIDSAFVLISNDEDYYELRSNNNGDVVFNNFREGVYKVLVAKFGYKYKIIENVNITSSNSLNLVILDKGYYDDFFFDFKWKKEATATTGHWIIGEPNRTSLSGTIVNPDFDENGDFGDKCYVTGNAIGNVTADDIDNGIVTLTSPSMDLSTYQNPFINYSRWFTNIASAGTPNDTFRVMINNGAQTAVLEEVIGNNPDKGTWVAKSHRVKDYISLSNNMKLIVRASDLAGSDHITEAAFDKFFITDSLASGFDNKQNNIFANVYPNPSTGKVQVSYNLTSSKEGSIKVYDILGNVIYEKSLTETSGIVNVSIQNKGMYFIRIESNNEQKVIKLVRQ